MSDESRALEPVKFPRYERRGIFMGLKWYQLALVATGILVAIIASAAGGPSGLVVTAPMWVSLVLIGVLQYSRIPYPIWGSLIVLFFVRSVLGQTRYLARPERPVKAGKLALPGGLGNLKVQPLSRGECVILDAPGKEAMVVLRCSTRSFALLDDDDKAWAAQAWSRVQAGLAQRSDIARIAVQDYTVPYPSSALQDFYDRTVTAVDGERSSWGQVAYQDLISAAGSAMSHDVLLSLVVDTSKSRRRIKESGGGKNGLERLLRLEVGAITTSLATHGVRVDEWLSESKLLSVLRGAFDPETLAHGSAKSEHQPSEEMQPLRQSSGPMAVEEHWTYLRSDSGFHQTFWVAEWPRQKVYPGFLHPLVYVGDFRHTVTQVIRTVPTIEALRDIRSAQEAHETRRRINARFDRPTTREQRAEEEEVSQREEEIVAGHGDVRPTAFVTITAESLEDLARHRHELESAAAGAFVELRLLAGQQWAAFIAGGLPLGRGLR
ncbi:SCO6880 family protein [Paenarthrobacter sp. TA1.8]|uniref:SCO6880 family protein n=1 Tax=Paenarthrobacter sp. TA1.8 TaxID=3400219 RepID=UPI003B42BB39